MTKKIFDIFGTIRAFLVSSALDIDVEGVKVLLALDKYTQVIPASNFLAQGVSQHGQEVLSVVKRHLVFMVLMS